MVGGIPLSGGRALPEFYLVSTCVLPGFYLASTWLPGFYLGSTWVLPCFYLGSLGSTSLVLLGYRGQLGRCQFFLFNTVAALGVHVEFTRP
jgi:hypothetical protein